MARLLFHKTGTAVWISHLDLMRLFQRSFKRAGLLLKHTQGFNPRPSVSIALPLSVGIQSHCELLDFELEGMDISCEEIRQRLAPCLIDGIEVMEVYNTGRAIKHLAYLDCCVTMEYDAGVPAGCTQKLAALFQSPTLVVEKKGKNGITQQDIVSMIRNMEICEEDGNTVVIRARVCCQNPTLNPMQLHHAVCTYLPELTPDFAKCCRNEIFDHEGNIFR